MDPTALQAIAANNDWVTIFPELLLGCVALVLLALEIVLPVKYHSYLPGVALFGVLAIIPSQIISLRPGFLLEGDTFNGLLHQSHDSQVMRVFFLVTAVLVCLLGTVSLAKQRMPHTEFYHIVLVVTAALMLLTHFRESLRLLLRLLLLLLLLLVQLRQALPLLLRLQLHHFRQALHLLLRYQILQALHLLLRLLLFPPL